MSKQRVPLFVESLESRELLAVVSWINPLGGDWNVAANWSTGSLPGAADDVVIAQASNVTITHSALSNDTIRSLTLNQAQLAITGGSLATVQNFTLAGGTLAGVGNLTINGTTNITGGSMTGAGRTIAVGGMTISGFTSLDARTLENRGLAQLTNSNVGINPTISLHNGAKIENAAGAIWDFQVDTFIETTDASATSFTNFGTVKKTATIGTVNLRAAFTNTGAVDLQAGTFSLKAGGSATGSFTLASGTSLAIDGGTFTFNSGASVTGSGGTKYGGGSATFSPGSTYSASGPIAISAGTANFSSGNPILVSGLTQTGGTLTGSDTITAAGVTNWIGGTMSGTGTTVAGVTRSITGVAWLSGGATFTTSVPHLLATGQSIAINGMTPAGFNGLYTIVSVPNANQFTVALAVNPGTATVFGLATSGALTLGTNLTLSQRTLQYAGAIPWSMPTGSVFHLQSGGSFTYPGSLGSTTPGLSATMTVALAPGGDVNNDGLADPGDTLQYTVTITNNGATNAENLIFTDALDPNTVLVSESVTYPTSVTATVITDADLANIAAAAIARWQDAGISSTQLATLKKLTFRIADLEGLRITQAVGTSIAVDQTGGGQGWFVDASPIDDAEFATIVSATRRTASPPNNPAYARLDLLTAVMRQMGAVLGISAADSPDLMGGVLAPSTRNAPTSINTLSVLKANNGFYFLGQDFLNFGGQNEKWFADRNEAFYFILPTGKLAKWDAISMGTSIASSTLPNVGTAVYDDLNLLFHAQVTIAPATQATLTAQRTANGFFTNGDFLKNILGSNEKWIQDRANAYYAILPTGFMVKFNGVSIASSMGSAVNVGTAAYDDPTLLTNAPVVIDPAITTKMSALRTTFGFYQPKDYFKNATGNNEKYFQDRLGNFFVLLPNGNVLRYVGANTFAPSNTPVETLNALIYDDPTLLFNAPITIPAHVADYLPQFRATYGFHSFGSYLLNTFGDNEKWFQDRNQNYFMILPNGDLLRWDSVSYATSKKNPIGNLGSFVYDDPNLLFNANIPQTAAGAAQLEFYRTTYGFRFLGDFFLNFAKENDKWFGDRNGNFWIMLPNGSLFKWDGISFSTSKANPIANLGPLVYDNPHQLFNAAVTLSSATIDTMASLRTTYGFRFLGDFFLNFAKENDKWFGDRNGNFWIMLPNGSLFKWDGISFSTSKANPIANLGAVVYDDPNLLFNATREFATSLPPLGSLGVGQSRVITYQARINDELVPPQNTPPITNQGTITGFDTLTGTPYTPVMTDDPALPGAADPTRIAVIPQSVFEDPDLEAAVNEALGLPVGHVVKKSELLLLTSLSVNGSLITSLKGLEFASNLQSFTLQPSDWSVTTPLASLTPLGGLTSLSTLSLVRAGITNAQLAALGSMPGLRSLDLRYNAITNISAIANLPSLNSLHVYGNAIADFAPIAGKPIDLDLPPMNPDKAQTIADLAASLYKSPVEILQYVTNNVQNQFYTGSLKGPQATLETLAGNDWDQANLLKSLLDASGVFATRYISATIQAPVTTVQAWLGVNNSDAAGQLLATLNLRPVYITVGGVQQLQFDHTWVQMQTSALNPWIDLDPTWKFRDVQPGVPNLVQTVFFDEAAYLISQSSAGQNTKSPAEFYIEQVNAYLAANFPGTSLSDVPKNGAIRQQIFTGLPSTTPYTVVGVATNSGIVPNGVKTSIQISLAQGATTLFQRTLNIPDVSLNRITIDYQSAGIGLVTPRLMLDSTVLDTGATLADNSAVTMTLVVREPGNGSPTQTYTYARKAGQNLAIAVNAFQVSERLHARQRAVINDDAAAGTNGTLIDPSKQIGAVQALGLFEWIDQTNQAEAMVNALTGALTVYGADRTVAVATTDSYGYNAVDVTPNLQIPSVPRNVSLEVQNYFHQSLDLSADNTFSNTRSHLINFNASERTGAIWEDLLSVPSISAITALERANALLIPTLTITSANAASLMPTLTHDNATKTLIQNEIDAGATVVVPRDPISLGTFIGVGFYSRKANGQERYIISRANSGVAYLGSMATANAVAPSPVAYNIGTVQTLVDVGTPGERAQTQVNIASGNVVRTETDFDLPGIGLPLTFTRTYNSLSTINRGMGAGWSFSFSDFLTFNGDGSIGWTTDTGVLHTFAPDGGGGFLAPNTIHGSFTADGTGYTYRDPHGLVHRFDLTGKLTAIIDRNLNALNIAYNGSGEITTVTESGAPSRSLTFTYTSGKITAISDGTGRTWTYVHDPFQPRLLQAISPTNAITQYAYFTDTAYNGLLQQITAPDGGTSNFAYFGNRRAQQVTDATGDKQTFSYNLYRSQTTVADPRGNATVYAFNNVGNVTGITLADGTRETFVWSNNLKQSATDAFGFTEAYAYDANGNVTQTTDRLGNVTTRSYEASFNQIESLVQPGGRVTTYAYDANGNPTSITDPLGNVTAMTYNASGLLLTKTSPRGTATGTVGDFTTTYTYNDAGQILTRSTDLPSSESFTYDARGRMLTHTDANNKTTTFGYDLLDRLTTVTDPLNKTTTHAYDLAGNRISTTDALGRVTLFAYDLDGHLVKTTHPDGTYTTAQWDAAGNMVSSTDELGRLSITVYDQRNRPIQAIKPDGTSTLTRYDSLGHVIATTDEKGNVTKYTYDKLGRLLTTVNALNGTTTRTYDAVGNLLTVVDSLNRTTTYQYDLLNRKTQMKDPLNNITNYTYDVDGNLLTVAAPLAQTTQFAYDVLGRVTTITDALNRTVTRTYDAVGNLLTVAGPSGNVTTYTYDALNRLASQSNPASAAIQTFAYDFVGNMTSTADFNGRTTRYTYDQRNRKVQEEWLNGSNVSIYTMTFSYDAAGQLTGASDPSSSYHYTLDKAGRVLTADNYGSPGVPKVRFDYSYDAAGNLLTVRDLFGNVVHDHVANTYDALNRVARINNTTLTYNAASELTAMSRYSNAALTALVATGTYNYDANGNITALTYTQPAGTIAQNSWAYNAAGRITSRVSAGVTSNYTYNLIGELLTATQPSETYTYDANGNRTSAGFVYASGNRLTADGTFTYAYDNAGNLLTQTQVAGGAVTEYTWDYRNRLTKITFKNGSSVVIKEVTYTYDMFDRRIAKSVDSDGPGSQAAVVERYVYDGSQIALQFDGAGALSHRFVYGPSGEVLTDTNAAGVVLWALADNVGSVRYLLNSASVIVNQIAYDSYGRVISETNAAANFLYGFQGMVTDRDSGFQFDATQYYDPRIGRYVRQNALAFGVGDVNLYRFQGNNPLTELT